jgi:hypothetical protein
MTTSTVAAVAPATSPLPLLASRKALDIATRFWFMLAVIGQGIFVLYIIGFYGLSAANGNFAAWNKVLFNGHVRGDTAGNAALAVHILIAAFITLAGPLQLLPAIRARFPVLHRWTGRLYVLTAVIASLAGLYLTWTRTPLGSALQHVATSINAVLIIGASWYAVRNAMSGRLLAHRRWALRLFLLVSGSWFFRVLLMFWIAINGGPVGFDPKTFSGPALEVITSLQFLLPLAMLELYFFAQASAKPAVKMATAATLFVATAAMGVGIAVAAKAMWLPLIV